jgi:hypothetical protein
MLRTVLLATIIGLSIPAVADAVEVRRTRASGGLERHAASEAARPSRRETSQRYSGLGTSGAPMSSGIVASPWATSCPSPYKLAGGACVQACPGGHSDHGSCAPS